MECITDDNLSDIVQDQLAGEGVHPLPDYILFIQGVRLALNDNKKQEQ